jgi:hypothetical protein
LAVITDQRLNLLVSGALSDDFSESDLPWKVDIVDWQAITPDFRKIIEAGYEVIQEPNKSQGMAGEWVIRKIGSLNRQDTLNGGLRQLRWTVSFHNHSRSRRPRTH